LSAPFAYRCCTPWLLLESVDGEREIFLELARIVHTETMARYEDIAASAEAGACRDMGFEAHSLKGTVGAVGATELMALLQDIEHAGVKRGEPCSAEQLARLRQLLQLVRDDMDAFIRTL
jgi:HPt (histidine-containing phosphotransfer) domain-containing protein